jgi:hypothetical protein
MWHDLEPIKGGPQLVVGQGLGQVYFRLAFQGSAGISAGQVADASQLQRPGSEGGMRGESGLKKITAKAGWGALKHKGKSHHEVCTRCI